MWHIFFIPFRTQPAGARPPEGHALRDARKGIPLFYPRSAYTGTTKKFRGHQPKGSYTREQKVKRPSRKSSALRQAIETVQYIPHRAADIMPVQRRTDYDHIILFLSIVFGCTFRIHGLSDEPHDFFLFQHRFHRDLHGLLL